MTDPTFDVIDFFISELTLRRMAEIVWSDGTHEIVDLADLAVAA